MTSPESRMQEMRELFEQIMIDKGRRALLERGSSGRYLSNASELAWELFQAAWSARTMPVEAIRTAIDLFLIASRDAEDASISQGYMLHIAALTQLLEQGQ